MKTIRAFIAIELTDEAKRTITTVSGQMSTTMPSGAVRWVKPNALHVTLRFLGDTDERLVPEIGRALDVAAGPLPAFTLRLGQLGAFPNARRPRVIWIGLDPVAPATGGTLTDLKTAVDAAVAPFGWPPETKPFTAHLTLGRVRDERRPVEVAWDTPIAPIIFPVTAIHLIESELRPEGPRYTLRHSAALLPN